MTSVSSELLRIIINATLFRSFPKLSTGRRCHHVESETIKSGSCTVDATGDCALKIAQHSLSDYVAMRLPSLSVPRLYVYPSIRNRAAAGHYGCGDSITLSRMLVQGQDQSSSSIPSSKARNVSFEYSITSTIDTSRDSSTYIIMIHLLIYSWNSLSSEINSFLIRIAER